MKTNATTAALYIGMIGFCALGFGAISSWGAAHLRAPQSIGGQYQLAGLPGDCFAAAPPLLVLGQSGRYLGADIVPADAALPLRARALKGNGLLHGQADQNNQFQIAGSTRLGSCTRREAIALQATVTDGKLTGSLTLAGKAYPITGQLAEP